MKNLIFILGLILTLASCKQDTTKTLSAFTFNKSGGSPYNPTLATGLSLVSPATSPAFISTPTVLISGAVAGEIIRIYLNSSCSTLLGTVTPISSTALVTLSALPVGTHGLYTKSTNKYLTSSCSGAMMTYQYLGVAPITATGMVLLSPVSSPGTDSTPTLTLSGVLSGETSHVYIDAACTLLYGSATAAGTTVNVTLDPLAPGIYSLYTNSTNTAGTGSCSAALLSYDYTGVAPNTISSLTLFSPTTSPNYDATPTLLASGVTNGDTVNVYADSGCTALVGSALSTTTTVEVTVSALAVGSYTFYSNTTNVIGTSACSAALVTYNYAGPPPSVEIAWDANREQAVNRAGGGYRIYYRKTVGVNVSTDSFYDVPYISGAQAPVSKVLTDLLKGTTYFKVVAYSNFNAPGSTSGSVSVPSAEFGVTIP